MGSFKFEPSTLGIELSTLQFSALVHRVFPIWHVNITYWCRPVPTCHLSCSSPAAESLWHEGIGPSKFHETFDMLTWTDGNKRFLVDIGSVISPVIRADKLSQSVSGFAWAFTPCLVVGYTMTIFGIANRCLFAELPQIRQKVFVVDVAPRMPQIQLSTDLPKSPYIVTGGDHHITISAILQLFVGEE